MDRITANGQEYVLASSVKNSESQVKLSLPQCPSQEYVLASSVKNSERAVNTDGLKYVIVRTYSAGVFAGYLESRNGREVVLRNARRLWYWKGASSLSELAEKGVASPDECKFPCEVDKVELLEAIEILDVSEEAFISITSVPVWTQHT